jgi:hypothetical protein
MDQHVIFFVRCKKCGKGRLTFAFAARIKMPKKVLASINLWKGITILSVLNMHTCFWSGLLYLPDWTRRIALLLDIPVLFFISGYLLQGGGYRDTINRCLRQIRRLLTDYAVVTIIVLLILVTFRALLGKQPTLPDPWVSITSVLRLHPLGPLWSNCRLFGGSMWFLQVYLALLPLGAVVLSFFPKQTFIFISFISLSAFVYITRSSPSSPSLLLSYDRYITFYFSLFLAGAAFKLLRGRLVIGWLLAAWLCLVVITAIVCYQANELLSLQQEKFPPSLLYLLFSSHSVMIVCLLIFLEERKALPVNLPLLFAFVSWCGRNIYRIFLWQGIVTSVPYLFIPAMINAGLPVYAIYLLTLSWNVIVSVILTYFHNSLESVLIAVRNGNPRK